jgi:ankyrin repeat protein
MSQLGTTVDMADDESGWMPLCTAAAGGHADIIIFLIDSGARIDDQSTVGESPSSSLGAGGDKRQLRSSLT